MISRIAKWLTNQLKKRIYMSEEVQDVCTYAFDIMIYTICSTIALIAIGWSMGRTLQTLVCIAVFYCNQTIGGGYHAHSHTSCFLTMVVGLLVYHLLISLCIPILLWELLVVIAIVILFRWPLVLHKNKQYLEERRKELELRSRIVITVESIIYALFSLFPIGRVPIWIAASLLLCAISRMSAALMESK